MKIFVTVGAQMPFDRLIMTVDDWAGTQLDVDAFAQVGPNSFKPTHMEWVEFIEPDDYRERVMKSDVLIAHAGMGSIITALQYGKPIVIFPRLGRLQETRNDHQVATTKRFATFDGVHAALDETELLIVLDALAELSVSLSVISSYASPELLNRISDFIKKS